MPVAIKSDTASVDLPHLVCEVDHANLEEARANTLRTQFFQFVFEGHYKFPILLFEPNIIP